MSGWLRVVLSLFWAQHSPSLKAELMPGTESKWDTRGERDTAARDALKLCYMTGIAPGYPAPTVAEQDVPQVQSETCLRGAAAISFPMRLQSRSRSICPGRHPKASSDSRPSNDITGSGYSSLPYLSYSGPKLAAIEARNGASFRQTMAVCQCHSFWKHRVKWIEDMCIATTPRHIRGPEPGRLFGLCHQGPRRRIGPQRTIVAATWSQRWGPEANHGSRPWPEFGAPE